MIIELTGQEVTILVFALRERNFEEENLRMRESANELQVKLLNSITNRLGELEKK